MRMVNWFRVMAIVAVWAIVAQAAAPALAQTPMASPAASPVSAITPTLTKTECMYDLPAGVVEGENVECGYVTAALYPDGSKPGTVELATMRFKATGDAPRAEPLVILLGGPGQDMSAVLPLLGTEYPIWTDFVKDQDVILFDQRGMGKSIPSLACTFEQPAPAGATPEAPSDFQVGMSLTYCARDLRAAGIDPTAFNTENNAADVEALRQAYGDDKIDLYGVSYGSNLALATIRAYPDSVRTTVISSPLPMEVDPFAGQAIGFDRALKVIWAACAEDETCAADNPDPAQALLDAVARLKSSPMNVQVMDPTTQKMITLPIDASMFMQLVYLGVFVGSAAPSLPNLVTTVANGDGRILSVFAQLALIPGGITMGALFTYMCQDYYAFISPADTQAAIADANLIPPLSDGTWSGLAAQMDIICGRWKLPASAAVQHEAVRSDKDVLILTGEFDPITPPSYGEMVHANMPNSTLINFTNEGHDPASGDPTCSNALILSYLADANAPLDASCAAAPIDFSKALSPEDATPVASPIATPVHVGN